MATLPHTSTNPTTETPSTSSLSTGGVAQDPSNSASTTTQVKESVAAADVGSQGSKMGTTGEVMSAEKAAEKLYEERIEEEYAKREGGA